MNLFSISQLEQYSGIKAHTLRIWEQRYNTLVPLRSEGNTRYYDGNQLRRLLNIVSLMNTGLKISKLSYLPDEQLYSLINEKIAERETSQYEHFVLQLISCALTFDENKFDTIYKLCTQNYGVTQTYIHVIYPFLNRIGLLWNANEMVSSNEHFITNLIRKKIFSAIDQLETTESEIAETWVLFLPENEFHEIGLLYAHYILKSSGIKVIYLGSNVPFDALDVAMSVSKATRLYFFFVHTDSSISLQKSVELLAKKFPDLKILISASDTLLSPLILTNNCVPISNLNNLLALIPSYK